MKKYICIIVIVFIAISCDDFLDTKDLTNKNSENFPSNSTDANQALSAIYHSMALAKNGSVYIGTLASDDGFGAGAANDYVCHGYDRMRVATADMAQPVWENYYAGIFRINKLLGSIDNIKFGSENERKTVLGEAYFMRAFFYSELSKLFGEVPLILSAAKPVNFPKSPAATTYAQIGSDLKVAIENLPSEQFGTNPDRFGHANKWAAEGLLARVFMFYTGYYQQTDLPIAGGGSFTKAQVIVYLEDLINNSGHELVPDFRNLWPYTNSITKEDYTYTKDKGLSWAGDNNIETVFAIKYGNVNSWSLEYNEMCQDFGIRGQTNLRNVFPFGDGYGQSAVNPIFVKEWEDVEPTDSIRRWGSIIDVENPREGIKKYLIGGWNCIEETKMFTKKYSLIHAYTDKTDPDPLKWKFDKYTVILDGATKGTAATQDLVLIRFSDVLLMHSELTETPDKMNLVRARAGLAATAYSLQNMQNERRFELALEGLRYYDLLRWYGKEAGVIIDQNQNGADILNDKVPGKYNADLTERIRATGGFIQIPESEISLSNNVLKQNEGWSGEGINLE